MTSNSRTVAERLRWPKLAPLPLPPQLPASFFAYRKQQHRWTCGPIQLWSKASADIWNSQLPLLRWVGSCGEGSCTDTSCESGTARHVRMSLHLWGSPW